MVARVVEPDAQLVQTIITTACKYSAEKMGTTTNQVIRWLTQGCAACHCHFRRYLATSICRYLGTIDSSLKAAYLFANTSQDIVDPISNINILLWVSKDSPALLSLISWFDSQAVMEYTRLLGEVVAGIDSVLDVQVVNDYAVEHRIGYGALINCLQPPVQAIWTREDNEPG